VLFTYSSLTLQVSLLLHHLVPFALKPIHFLPHVPQELPVPLDLFDHVLQLILDAPEIFQLNYVLTDPLDPSKAIIELILNRNRLLLFLGRIAHP
jgi:hypothetical protein